MVTLKIFKRKVKVRTFKEMMVSEYLQLKGELDVVKYIALQVGEAPDFLMHCNMNHHITGKIGNIDINALDTRSVRYDGKTYIDFHNIPYGVHYTSEAIFRDKRENQNLWVFAIALNYKVSNNFNMSEIKVVYDGLMNQRAIDVIPTMNYFITGFYKKKVLTTKNLITFIKMFPTILKVSVLRLWSSTMRKIRYRKYLKSLEKA